MLRDGALSPSFVGFSALAVMQASYGKLALGREKQTLRATQFNVADAELPAARGFSNLGGERPLAAKKRMTD